MDAASTLDVVVVSGPTSTVLDGLGHGTVAEVTLDTIKSRFFGLGLQAGIALQMLAVSVMMIGSSGKAVEELSSLYYPIFRGLFLLGFFASMHGILLFAWKRTGIDYAAILGVPAEHNYHSTIRAGFTLVSLNFACFVLYFLTLTVGLTRTKDVWPAAAVIFSMAYLMSPFSWMSEWNDAAQRASLGRTIGRVLVSPFSAPTFAHSFVADVFTSMPKCAFDLFYTLCVYGTGEAPWGAGEWNNKQLAFTNGLHICTESNAPYRAARLVLSVLPFWLRLMQCARGYYDGRCQQRRHLANGLKYCCSISVVVLSSLADGTHTRAWLALSIISTVYALLWDVFIDWGLGPAWWREWVHGEVSSQPVSVPPSNPSPNLGLKRGPSSTQLNVAAQLERNRKRMARQSYESYAESPSRERGGIAPVSARASPPPPLLSSSTTPAHGGALGNWLLRPVRVFPDSVYLCAIGLNCVARLGWAIYISEGQQIVAQNTILVLGAVELYRRAQWALLRVEWEQISRSWQAAKESEQMSRHGGGAAEDEVEPAVDGGLGDALLRKP